MDDAANRFYVDDLKTTMRAQLMEVLRAERDKGLAEIDTALRVAVLVAAGHKLPAVQLQLRLTDPQYKSARRRLQAVYAEKLPAA